MIKLELGHFQEFKVGGGSSEERMGRNRNV